MEDADKELKEIEDMLRALAAEDRAGRAEDAALLARLCHTADSACRHPGLRPWYRSPMLWRSAAVLALLVALPSLWVWLQAPAERNSVARHATVAADTVTLAAETTAESAAVRAAGQVPPAVAVVTLAPEMVAESAAVAVVDCGPPTVCTLPQPAAIPTAVAMVDEECIEEPATHGTAIAVYSGGADADYEAEESEAEWGVGADALAVNHAAMAGRSAPAKLKRSAAPMMQSHRAKAKKAARPRSITDKLKTYAEALHRATAQP